MAQDETITYDVNDNHGHVPVMRERMAQLLAPAVEAAGENAVIVAVSYTHLRAHET